MLLSAAILAGPFTFPVRMLFVAVIVTATLQTLKLFIPRLNGWVAVATNLVLTIYGVYYLLGHEVTTIAVILMVALTAAGMHGTSTKLSDHLGTKDNPTPSGPIERDSG